MGLEEGGEPVALIELVERVADEARQILLALHQLGEDGVALRGTRDRCRGCDRGTLDGALGGNRLVADARRACGNLLSSQFHVRHGDLLEIGPTPKGRVNLTRGPGALTRSSWAIHIRQALESANSGPKPARNANASDL